MADYKDYIKGLPTIDVADIFGQHNNADIFSRSVESTDLLYNVIKITAFVEPAAAADKDKKEGQEEEK